MRHNFLFNLPWEELFGLSLYGLAFHQQRLQLQRNLLILPAILVFQQEV
jgi:hypothetical protein